MSQMLIFRASKAPSISAFARSQDVANHTYNSASYFEAYTENSVVIDPSGDRLLGVYNELVIPKKIIVVYQVSSARLRVSPDCLFSLLLDANARSNPGKPFLDLGE